MAIFNMVSLESVRRSYSQSIRRHPPNQPKVRSTIQRFGSTENPGSFLSDSTT
jgi:hypothetical protein